MNDPLITFRDLMESPTGPVLHRVGDIARPDLRWRAPDFTTATLAGALDGLSQRWRQLRDCRLKVVDCLRGEDCAYLSWEISRPARWPQTQRPVLRGMSLLRFADQLYYVEDSFDRQALRSLQAPARGSRRQHQSG